MKVRNAAESNGSLKSAATQLIVRSACVAAIAGSTMMFAQAPAGAPTAGQQPPTGMQRRPPRIPKPGIPAIKKDMAEIEPKATIYPVEGSPDWSVITPEATWVTSSRANHVVQLLNKEGKPGLIVDVNRPCSGLTSGFGSIWSTSCMDKKLNRIDPKTGKITASIDAEPENSEGGITASPDAIWLVVKPSTLVRIDPKTNTIAAKIELPSTAANPTYGGGFVWVSTFENNSVVKVDPKKNAVVATVPTGPKPRFITYGADSVWTLNQGDGSVTRIDGKTNKVLATIQCGIPGSGGDLSFGDGYVWATMFEFPLTKIDPKTNQPVRQWAGPGGDGMRAGGGYIWLSNLRLQSVWRIPTTID